MENDEAGLKSLYAELARAHPNAEFCARAPLDFTSGADFENALREYVTVPLRKGVPSLFRELAGLYSDTAKTPSMEKVFVEVVDSLRSRKAFPGAPSGETEKKPEATLANALTLLAYHRDKTGDREAALACVDEAIALDITSDSGAAPREAAFLKRSGDYAGAVVEAQIARRGDLVDQYLNGACVKRLLQNGQHEEAERTAALFARDGDQASNLYDMQCAWFENEAGWCHARGQPRRALKYFAAVIQHYEDTEEDQFDFHSYCMRKSTLRSYVEMLRATDAVYDKPRFREAAAG